MRAQSSLLRSCATPVEPATTLRHTPKMTLAHCHPCVRTPRVPPFRLCRPACHFVASRHTSLSRKQGVRILRAQTPPGDEGVPIQDISGSDRQKLTDAAVKSAGDVDPGTIAEASKASTAASASPEYGEVVVVTGSTMPAASGTAGKTVDLEDTNYAAMAAADNAEEAVDQGAQAVSEGIDQTASAIEEGTEQVQKGAEQAAEGLAQGVSSLADQTQQGVDEASERLTDAIDETADNLQTAGDKASDMLRDFSTPGPAAPFASVPLTCLSSIPPSVDGASEDPVAYHKKRVLYCIAGLDRGFAANKLAVASVEAAVDSLVSAVGAPIILSWSSGVNGKGSKSSMSMFEGTWRLLYSSGFATGGLGGRQPGPPAALLPVTLGQVYQVISNATARLDNVVEFYGRYNLPSLPGLPEVEPIVTTARLKHTFEAVGEDRVQITFETTDLKTTGGINGVLGRLPELRLPELPEGLRPSRLARSSTFEVIFLDEDLRITRGNRGELRVFART